MSALAVVTVFERRMYVCFGDPREFIPRFVEVWVLCVLYDDADLCVYLHVCMCAHSVSQESSQLWLAITVTRLNGFLSLHCARPKQLCWELVRRGCHLPHWGSGLGVLPRKIFKVFDADWGGCFTMPPQVTCASALPFNTGKHENFVFQSALPEFNQLLLDFFNVFDSWLILKLLYDSLNHVINAFSSGLLGGMVQEKGSWECCLLLQQLDCVACTMHQCTVCWVSAFAR